MLLDGLLLIAGVATGFQTLRHFLWIVWGAPPNWLALIGLAGSVLICVGGLRAMRKTIARSAMATLGLLMAGTFYVPALYVTLSSRPWADGAQAEDLVTIFGPSVLLLVVSLAILGRALGRRRLAQAA